MRWERGFVIAAVLATALGLALLDDMVAAGAGVIARVSMVTYLFGAVVVVVAETAYLSSGGEFRAGRALHRPGVSDSDDIRRCVASDRAGRRRGRHGRRSSGTLDGCWSCSSSAARDGILCCTTSRRS
ncbi:MAG: hypothetical protein U0521_23025 [Anaerolineae bacterium]